MRYDDNSKTYIFDFEEKEKYISKIKELASNKYLELNPSARTGVKYDFSSQFSRSNNIVPMIELVLEKIEELAEMEESDVNVIDVTYWSSESNNSFKVYRLVIDPIWYNNNLPRTNGSLSGAQAAPAPSETRIFELEKQMLIQDHNNKTALLTKDFQVEIDKLKEKLRLSDEKCKALESEVIELDKEIENLEATVESQKETIAELQKNQGIMRLVEGVAGTEFGQNALAGIFGNVIKSSKSALPLAGPKEEPKPSAEQQAALDKLFDEQPKKQPELELDEFDKGFIQLGHHLRENVNEEEGEVITHFVYHIALPEQRDKIALLPEILKTDSETLLNKLV